MNPKWEKSMDVSQIIIFVVAAAAVLVVYGLFKFMQSRKNSKQSHGLEPKMRPQGTSVIKTGTTVDVQNVAEITKPETVASEVVKKDPEPAVASVENSTPKPTKTQTEPTAENAFAPLDEEYPYFDQSDYTFGSVTPALARMMPSSEEGRVKTTQSLHNAGYYSPHAWHNLTAIRYLCMMAPVLFFGILLVLVPEPLETSVVIALVVVTALGWALPVLYVRGKAKDRLRKIGNGMPDMLDLLNMCVSQGMTVTSALGRVGRDIEPVYPALSKEMKIVTEQAHIGSLSQSLTNLSDRVDLSEIHSFSTLLVQTELMGTSVSEALSEYSDNMRESMKQRADEKANSATFKLLFPTVLCLMPAVYLFLLGPAVVELNRFYEGGAIDALSTEIPEEFTGG